MVGLIIYLIKCCWRFYHRKHYKSNLHVNGTIWSHVLIDIAIGYIRFYAPWSQQSFFDVTMT